MVHLSFTISLAALLAAPRSSATICLAPPSVQFAGSDPAQAIAAVTEMFKSYLTGPSLTVTPLAARLASQAREEARQAHCQIVLFITAIREHRSESGGVLGRIATRAAVEGSWAAGVGASTVTKRVASWAAEGAARAAADMASTTKTHDELELSYRLESETGAVLKESKAKRKAKSDGEDLLTPLVEHAAEEIAAVVVK